MSTEARIPGTGAPAPAERPAHRDGNVLRWLGAYTATAIGDAVYFVALAWAATRSGDPGQAGLVLAVGAVPRAVLMLVGGVVADRFGPRRVVIGSDAARCLVILAVAAVLAVATPGLWLLLPLALVFGTVDALFLPAVGALPPRLTTPGQLARVQGMRGLAARIALIGGAPLGGAAVTVGGSAAAFGVAGVLFAVSLGLLLAVRLGPVAGGPVASGAGAAGACDPDGAGAAGAGDPKPGPTDSDDPRPGLAESGDPEPGPLRQLLDGLRYIRRHRLLAPLLLATAVGEIGFSGPANIGLVLLADERGWGASGMSLVIAGFGVGAGGASLLLAVRGRLPRAGAVLCVALVAGAVLLAALAFAPSVPVAALAGCGIGLFVGLNGALCAALIQTSAAPALIGRVTSVSTLFTMGVAPLCYPVVGGAIGLWGSGPVFVAGAALSAGGGVFGLCVTALRRAQLP
ncbi:MFS transporter [Streptomyces sp. NPDC002851]